MLSYPRFTSLLILFAASFQMLTGSMWGNIPHPCSKENKYLIAKPVINLHAECSEDSPYVSQGIYGHSLAVITNLNDGWALVETEDGYQGFAKLDGIVGDDPLWRTSRHLVRVSSVAGMVYPINDTERPALMRLPFGSRVELLVDLDATSDRWLEVKLADGAKAWMQRGDLEKIKTKDLSEMMHLAKKFLELPYIWGGTSSEGFDCSGYVQTLYKETGILLPRDSRPQAESELVFSIDVPENPGDLVFFGETRIAHVGLYLGDGNFIHSGVRDNKPKVSVSRLGHCAYNLFAARRAKKPEYHAEISPITGQIKDRMKYSWQEGNPVSLTDLRYIKISHWGFDGCIHKGEMIVHKDAGQEIVDIFAELFEKQYPIEKMLLIDAYEGKDELSSEDNNTYAFCSRKMTGSKEWSYHSFGRAIAINPLLNPYKKGSQIIPENGEAFVDRGIHCKGLITEEDPCYKAFIARGWKWGGHWEKERGYVDYQHFYKVSE